MPARLSLFLSLLLATCALAAKPLGRQLCTGACYYALNKVKYAGANATEQTDCKNPLKVSSIYFCMKQHCDEEDLDIGIDWWTLTCKKSKKAISVKGYKEATANATTAYIASLPTVEWKEKPVINTTAVPSPKNWAVAHRSIYTFAGVRHFHDSIRWVQYGFWGLVILIGITSYALSFLPVRHAAAGSGSGNGQRNPTGMDKTKAWLKSNLLMAPTFKHHHHQTLGWFTLGLRPQSLVIVAYIIMQIVLLTMHYPSFKGNIYYNTVEGQNLRIFSDRLGILMSSAVPFLFLFGGRGNLLILVTGWSFRTFNIFHRWVALIFTLQGIVHGITFSAFYVVDNGWSDYRSRLATDETILYGIMMVIALGLVVFLSLGPIRKRFYELFKISHIVLTAVFLAALYMHIEEQSGGAYIAWVYAAIGLWCGDYVMRCSRMLLMSYKSLIGKGSLALASYSEDTGMIRLQVQPSINSSRQTPGTYYYVYFPTWRPWEIHPFTLAGRSVSSNDVLAYQSDQASDKQAGTQSPRVTELSSPQGESYMTFMIRPRNGMTRKLRDKLMQKSSSGPLRMRVFLEGPYGTPARFNRFDNILFIAGGSGITTVLPYLRMFFEDRVGATFTPNVQLSWIARDNGFVRDVLANDLRLTDGSPLAASKLNMEFYVTSSRPNSASQEKENRDAEGRKDLRFKGTRPDIDKLVEEFVTKSQGRVAVFVCGPAQMADKTRLAVIKQTKSGVHDVELFEEMFGW